MSWRQRACCGPHWVVGQGVRRGWGTPPHTAGPTPAHPPAPVVGLGGQAGDLDKDTTFLQYGGQGRGLPPAGSFPCPETGRAWTACLRGLCRAYKWGGRWVLARGSEVLRTWLLWAQQGPAASSPRGQGHRRWACPHEGLSMQACPAWDLPLPTTGHSPGGPVGM